MDMNKLMKQVQKLQARMQKIQEELAAEEIEGSAGGGMVKAVVNGQQEILEIKIEPDILEDGDIEMLQDLVVAAVNDAIKKSKERAGEKMASLTGGMNIPGLF